MTLRFHLNERAIFCLMAKAVKQEGWIKQGVGKSAKDEVHFRYVRGGNKRTETQVVEIVELSLIIQW